jgi:hypothetical protein
MATVELKARFARFGAADADVELPIRATISTVMRAELGPGLALSAARRRWRCAPSDCWRSSTDSMRLPFDDAAARRFISMVSRGWKPLLPLVSGWTTQACRVRPAGR